jgi:two-component system response regulator PilR (NtrC family)
MTATALIIDDEPDIRELLAMTLTRMGLDFHTAANLEEARQLLSNYEFDVCLTDMRLPDGNGVDFVRYIVSAQPRLPVAVITAHGNMEAAVDAMKNGAYDFVSKPVDIQQLRQLVVQAVALNANEQKQSASNDPVHSHDGSNANDDVANQPDNASLPIQNQQANDQNLEAVDKNSGQANPASISNLLDLSGRKSEHKTPIKPINSQKLIGQSSAMQSLRLMIAKVARTNAPIWITGESGTGKELIATLIHENSARAEKPFVAINCGAIPSELMESELFGHLKGSFTGAASDSEGLFRRAHGGTLFLDEVAELPLQMQVKLLRAIQERSVRPVGGNEEIPVDVRILSASHKDLVSEVEAARFRHDLYYRLNVISLESPSLRERKEDIPALCSFVLSKLKAQNAAIPKNGLSDEALTALTNYPFPGNVRELENLLERAVALVDNDIIEADDLNLQTQKKERTQATVTDGKLTDEKTQIMKTLESTRWNRKAAAQKLGITYRQLRYRIQQLGINEDSE